MWRIRRVDESRGRHSEVYQKRDDAVARLKEHEHRVSEIKRGRRLPDPPPRTFDEVADRWLKTGAPAGQPHAGPTGRQSSWHHGAPGRVLGA
jgi:hypothetical protein